MTVRNDTVYSTYPRASAQLYAGVGGLHALGQATVVIYFVAVRGQVTMELARDSLWLVMILLADSFLTMHRNVRVVRSGWVLVTDPTRARSVLTLQQMDRVLNQWTLWRYIWLVVLWIGCFVVHNNALFVMGLVNWYMAIVVLCVMKLSLCCLWERVVSLMVARGVDPERLAQQWQRQRDSVEFVESHTRVCFLNDAIRGGCVICLGDLMPGQRVRMTNCQHKYHADCVDGWLAEQQTCPTCRQQLGRAQNLQV